MNLHAIVIALMFTITLTALPVGAQSGAAISPAIIELCDAAKRGDTDEIERQLSAGTPIHGRDSKGFSPITRAAESGRDNAVILLLKRGANPNARVRSSNGRSALALAAAIGDLRVVKVLLDAGAKPNMRGFDGSTALGRAAHGGHEEIARLLLKRGAAANGWGKYVEDSGRTCTPLFLSAAAAHPDIVKMLLDAGAPADQKLTNRDSMFAISCSGADARTLKLLLDAGANIGGRLKNNGPTALQVAIYNSNRSAIRFLFENGVVEQFDDRSVQLAQHEARSTGDRDIVDLVERMLTKHVK